MESDDEFTSGQIWLTNGEYNNSDSIEVGWMVSASSTTTTTTTRANLQHSLILVPPLDR